MASSQQKYPEELQSSEELQLQRSLQAEEHKKLRRKVLWKLDVHILPPLALLWLANFIDRTNVGNARIAGLETDTHLVGNQFNIALAVFYATYIVVEMPSNWILKKLKANRWLPFIVLCWGAVTTLSGLIHNFAGLVAIRVCLGFCEGGLLSGIVLYLSTIYKPHELQLRIGIFYASASLSGAFGGLLATAILKMDGIGGLAGWRWIFILEGIATCLLSIMSTFVLPADLSTAYFLTEEEREYAVQRFHDSQVLTSAVPAPNAISGGTDMFAKSNIDQLHQQSNTLGSPQAEEEFEWREVIRGITDPQCWLTGVAYGCILVSLYSFSLFLPTIVAGLGYAGETAQLRTVPPYVPAVILVVVVSFLSDRLKWRGPFILMFLPIAIAGYVLAIVAETNQNRYVAVFLMAIGVYPSVPAVLTILPNNNSGHYKRATTTALQLAIANTGGFVATFAYTADQAPRYIRGHSIVLGFLCAGWVLISLNMFYCLWENNARRLGRRQGNISRYEELWKAGKTRAPIGDRHPDFLFTI